MLGNSFGQYLGIVGFGESHGPAVGVVLQDIKPGIKFPLEYIQAQLDKRRTGKSFWASSRSEKDRIQILSGVFEGKTTGMPICLIVYNQDKNSRDYEYLKDIFRPGHADFTYYHKFKIYDYRGGGRASGRETIARVAAGNAVQHILGNIELDSYPVQIGEFKVNNFQRDFENDLLWPDRDNYEALLDYLSRIKSAGDSVGGLVETVVRNVPAGLGDPVFEKLDGNMAKAIISVGAVKGIEFGAGFSFAGMTGSSSNDQIGQEGFLSNNSGGILGGISTGQEIKFRYAVKPVPSIGIKQKSITRDGREVFLTNRGRFDICLIPRIIPVTNAMVKLVLADAISYQKLLEGKEPDLTTLREAIDKIDEDILVALTRRDRISQKIGEFKKRNNLSVEDKTRESEIFKLLSAKISQLKLDRNMVNNIWYEIIKNSKQKQ